MGRGRGYAPGGPLSLWNPTPTQLDPRAEFPEAPSSGQPAFPNQWPQILFGPHVSRARGDPRPRPGSLGTGPGGGSGRPGPRRGEAFRAARLPPAGCSARLSPTGTSTAPRAAPAGPPARAPAARPRSRSASEQTPRGLRPHPSPSGQQRLLWELVPGRRRRPAGRRRSRTRAEAPAGFAWDGAAVRGCALPAAPSRSLPPRPPLL